MDIEIFKSDWAAWLALFPAILVAVIVLKAIYSRSPHGQLKSAMKNHRDTQKELNAARTNASKAAARLEKLSGRSEKVKPRVLEEAKGALEDCRALEQILGDKCQVSMNHLRRVIFEEFPPSRHAKMREKYLPQDVEDGRPFSF